MGHFPHRLLEAASAFGALHDARLCTCIILAKIPSFLHLLPTMPGREGHDLVSSLICPVGISWALLGAWFPSPRYLQSLLSYRFPREWPQELRFVGSLEKGPSLFCLGVRHFGELLRDGGSS